MKRVREDNQPKPRALSQSIKRLIYLRSTTDRKTPREFLANQLIKEITDGGHIPPTQQTTIKYISKFRNIDNPLDTPWNLASCSQYSSFFPPESIPFLAQVKGFFDEQCYENNPLMNNYRKMFSSSPSDFSIRSAIWMVRLKPLIDNLFADLMVRDETVRTGYPIAIPMYYALAEVTSEAMGEEEFNSIDLDNALFSRDLDTFGKICRLMVWDSAKPITCDHDCDKCNFVNYSGRLCAPKRKESGN